MTVFFLEPDGTEMSVNRVAAAIGFGQMGEEVCPFIPDQFEGLDLATGDIVVGGIGFAHRAFGRLGIPVPALDAMPNALVPFAGRRIWQMTMGEVRSLIQRGEAIFAKPVPTRHKLFDGALLATVRDLIATAGVADAEPVVCANPVTFVSEYRCFVLRGDIVGVRPYKGDPLIFPDGEMIRTAVAAFDPAPSGYALDIGVTDDGRSLVVEINDGYASAPYGLTPLRYANVIAARWDELYRTAQSAH